MWDLEWLVLHYRDVVTVDGDNLIPCRPGTAGKNGEGRTLINRARWAWAVLCGKADAFVWPMEV